MTDSISPVVRLRRKLREWPRLRALYYRARGAFGATLASVYDVFQEAGLTQARFFGFDSFEGLPPGADKEGKGMWTAGQCSCPIDVAETLLKAHHVDWRRRLLDARRAGELAHACGGALLCIGRGAAADGD